MIEWTPSELPIAGMLVPPSLVAGLIGFIAASIAGRILNRTRLSRFFWSPPLAFLAIWLLLSVIADVCLFAL